MSDYKPFVVPLIPPSSAPHDGALHTILFNDDWAPIVLGALFVLWDALVWEGDPDDILQAQILAEQLFNYLGVAAMANVQITGGLEITDTAGNTRAIKLSTGGVGRWEMRANGTAEAGSNVGSDLEIARLDDSGASLETLITMFRSSGRIAIGNTAVAGRVSIAGRADERQLIVRGHTTQSNNIFRVEKSDQAAVFVCGNGVIGVFGATPAARQSVTGSRGGNAALASLLTALATLGWITDNTTA